MDITTHGTIVGFLKAGLDVLCVGILYDQGWHTHMSNRILYRFHLIRLEEVRRHVIGSWRRYQIEMFSEKIEYWRNQGPGNAQVTDILSFIRNVLQGPAWDHEIYRVHYCTMERQQRLRNEGKFEEANRLMERMHTTINVMLGF